MLRRYTSGFTGQNRRGVALAVPVVALLLAPAVLACGASPGESTDREASSAPGRAERKIATRHARPGPERWVGEARLPRLAEPRRVNVRRLDRAPVNAVRSLAPGNLEDALQAMEPHEVMRALQEIEGPLEGAHYVLQRGSEVEPAGQEPRPVAGELSLVDCAFRDPEDPTRGRDFWIGGLRLEGAELFEGRIERHRELSVFGRKVGYSGRWNDLREYDGRLSGFGRTLDAEIDEAGREEIHIWRRDLLLDAEGDNTAAFREESDACPLEMTLHLRVEDRFETWERVELDGELRASRVGSDPGEAVAWATLIARWVSPDPEIIDPAQRTPRARLQPFQPLPATAPPRRKIQTLPPRPDLQIRPIEPRESEQ